MGWKGTLRKMQAASRRAERQAEKSRKIAQKRQELESAQYEVEEYESRIEAIKSVHKDCGEEWDWESIRGSLPPFNSGEIGPNEKKAKDTLANYKPAFLDKVFNRTGVKKHELEEEIAIARQKDKDSYEEWQELVDVAQKVLNGDLQTYKYVLEELSPFADISELGSSLGFAFENPRYLEITLYVHFDGVIPKEVKSFTQSGKLSVRQRPKSQYLELYQDYVCSCVLRLARETFAILPVETVYIHAIGELLNAKTGHIEECPILSVMIPKKTLKRLNFENIDCSDSMANFNHNMRFKKSQGFEIVEKVTPEA